MANGPADRRGARAPRWTFGVTRGDLGRGLLALVGAVLGIRLASWVEPDFEVDGWLDTILVAVGIFIVGFVLRPVLVRLAVLMGWFGAAVIGVLGQGLVIFVAAFDPNTIGSVTIVGSVLAAWIVAAVTTILVWVATAGTDDAVTASMLRRARRNRTTVPDPDVPGVLFVQVDGLPWPVLEWAVRAGTLPTLSRWIRSGSHHAVEWRPALPATTPASQMGILHGTIAGIPAFRWVDRTDGKVYVANRPADAAVIESRHSDGRGLLVDDGVSVSNLFTGDAPTAYATMSAIGRTQETRETRRALARHLVSPAGLSRSIPKLVAEVARERFQSRRAIGRDVRPRVPRGWSFTGERAALVGVLHDVNTALVADSMLSGRRSVYVDYVDYDAVAHHVGTLRPEAMATLANLDTTLGRLEQLAAVAPRPYHIVVLSDHGQSQGEVFADRYGEDLASLVSRLAEAGAVASSDNHEGLGTIGSVVASSSSPDTVMGRTFSRTSDRLATESYAEAAQAEDLETRTRGRQAGSEPADTAGDADEDHFIVFGSGNLGLVYVAGESHRLDAAELTQRFPGLLPGLRSHPGVSFVVVDTAEHGPVALGPRGEHHVREGVVVGEDPLASFGEHTAAFVLRAATMPEAPDIYVNSLVDELGEVAAFEGLVSCHGGLGGWQDRATLVWPRELPAPEGMVVGADSMHRLLVGWLEHLGHRRDVPTGERGMSSEPTVSG